MKQNVLAVLLLLLTGAAPASAVYCYRAGPENCSFEIERRRFCSWANGGNFSLWTHVAGTYAAGISKGREQGQLISRMACATGAATKCLQFRYFYDVDDIVDLSVSVRYAGSATTEPPLWTTSASRYPWDYAGVPIETSRPFQVVFTAKRRPDYLSSKYAVVVDNIQYGFLEGCEVSPASAKPPTPVPTTTTTQATTTTTAATTAATTNTEPEPTTAITGWDESQTQSVPADGSGDVSVKPPNKVPVIVGTVVAAIVLLLLVATIAVVMLRKKRRTKAEPFQADASRGDPHDLVGVDVGVDVDVGGGEPLYANCPGTLPAAQLPSSARHNNDRINHNRIAVDDARARTRAVPDASDYYSVVRSSDEPPGHDDPATSAQYARVNKANHPEPNLPNTRITRHADPTPTTTLQNDFSAPAVYAKVNKSTISRHTPPKSLNTNDSIYEVPDGDDDDDDEIDSSSTNESRQWRRTEPPAIGANADESIYEIPDDEVDNDNDNSLNHRRAERQPRNFSIGKNDSIYSIPDEDSGDSYYRRESHNRKLPKPPPNTSIDGGNNSIYAIPDDETIENSSYVNSDIRHAPVGSASSGSAGDVALSPPAPNDDGDRVYYILEEKEEDLEKEEEEDEDYYHSGGVPGGGGGGETTTAAGRPFRGRAEEEQQYNTLDFDTVRRSPRQAGRTGRERDTAPGAGPSDGVYHRLGAGDEDAYSEVGRGKRPANVIDSEYSHIVK